MKKSITIVLALTLVAVFGASLFASKRTAGKDQAICAHNSHRLSGGWFGACTSYSEAYKAAQKHTQDNPGHYASTRGCIE